MFSMAQYKCTVCGYEYDEDMGEPDSMVDEGTKFYEIPSDWKCPVCGAPKSAFELIGR